MGCLLSGYNFCSWKNGIRGRSDQVRSLLHKKNAETNCFQVQTAGSGGGRLCATTAELEVHGLSGPAVGDQLSKVTFFFKKKSSSNVKILMRFGANR
jgi:hypothetical protein